MSSSRLLTVVTLSTLLIAGCTQPAESCPSSAPVGLSQAGEIANHEGLPFRFPLDEPNMDVIPKAAGFVVSSSGPISERKYHAAEDYHQPAGTPVYAMADGRVSFSGRAGGYGWLIIIDHPQANLYSLYGHLSPSRWRIRSGTVEKGQLIAYLGDPDENGGSAQQPLRPHLHFGVRTGQRADYPGKGEWRFMAGWIKPCPQNLGWLQPSATITSQEIPTGGYPQPSPGFLVLWGLEILLVASYSLGGACMLIFGMRKNNPILAILPGIGVTAAGWIFYNNGILRTYTLLAIGMLMAAFGVFWLVRRSMPILS